MVPHLVIFDEFRISTLAKQNAAILRIVWLLVAILHNFALKASCLFSHSHYWSGWMETEEIAILARLSWAEMKKLGCSHFTVHILWFLANEFWVFCKILSLALTDVLLKPKISLPKILSMLNKGLKKDGRRWTFRASCRGFVVFRENIWILAFQLSMSQSSERKWGPFNWLINK